MYGTFLSCYSDIFVGHVMTSYTTYETLAFCGLAYFKSFSATGIGNSGMNNAQKGVKPRQTVHV